MSLVNTWVQAVDGKFYCYPVICGDGWYICFDDDDPPEIVVWDRVKGLPGGFLTLAGIKHSKLKKHLRASRVFPNGRGIRPSTSFHFRLDGPIPVPQQFSAVSEARPTGEGVYYAFPKLLTPSKGESVSEGDKHE